MAQIDLSWTTVILAFLSAWTGAYLGGYFKKKGENLATHEDIEKLKDQVTVITTTTKEIEAKISNEVWDRQKRWELKREVLFDATKRIAEIDNTLVRVKSVLDAKGDSADPDDVSLLKSEADARDDFLTASRGFDAARHLVSIVCGREVSRSLDAFAQVTNKIALGLMRDKDPNAYTASSKELALKLFRARAEIRKELGTQDPVDIQLSEHLAKK